MIVETGLLENGSTIEVHIDEDTQNPRKEWDNATVFVLGHRRYDLSNEHGFDLMSYAGSDKDIDEIEQDLLDEIGVDALVVKVWAYDHSQFRLMTRQPTASLFGVYLMDYGFVGFVYMTAATIAYEYGTGNDADEKAQALIEAEISTYNKYLNGEVYGYVIKDDDDEIVDSCWGFYDRDYMVEEATRIAEAV